MFVAVDVSSRNTSLSASSEGWLCFHSRRAFCTSGRSCSLACRVFFIAQAPFVQLMPQRRNFDGHPVLASQTLAHLGQRHIWLVRDPGAKHGFQRGHERSSMTTNRKAGSPPFRLKLSADLMHPSATDFKPARDVRRAFTTLQCVKHSVSQILRISAHLLPLLWARAA